MDMVSDLLYLFIPFVIAIIADFTKHSIDLSKDDGTCCGCCKQNLLELIQVFQC